MQWIDAMNDAVRYIERHLTQQIDYEQVAKVACCSSYHFQRMFAYMAGMGLAEYIRRRRMSLAAADLQLGGEKIIDVAAKYGYASPTAFNRAFQSVHGIAPSALRNEGVHVRSYPPITFLITIKGAEEMKYRVETKPAFRVVGVSQELQHEMERNFEAVPRLWQQVGMDGTLQKLIARMDAEPKGVLGVCGCGDAEQWRYYIAVASQAPAGEFEETIVPASTWAIFPGSGVCPQAIQELEQRIVTQWLPTSGYEYADGPDIELYLSSDPQQAEFEVWIPVKKQK